METKRITVKDIFDLLDKTGCIYILDESSNILAFTESISYLEMLKLFDKRVMKISNSLPMTIWVYND